MATTIDVRELPGRLEELLALAAKGEEVILADGDTPRARLQPLPPPPPPGGRIPGLHEGAAYWMAPDFDDPLPVEFWLGES